MDVRLRPSLVPAKRSQAQAVDVNGPGGGAPEGLNPSQAQAAPTSTGPNPWASAHGSAALYRAES